MPDPDARTRVVAVQLAVRLGEVERNLRHVEDVVVQAVREHAPDVVVLPEVATTPNVCHPEMRRAHLPVDGPALALLRRLAREHGCTIGAGALVVRGHDTFNTSYLVEPDGTAHLHDKDQPSMWENAFYAAGDDDGIAATRRHGDVGVVSGFEWIRTRTARRLRGRVRLIAGGMCFPGFPQWRLTRRWFWDRDHRTMLQLARETPGRMARLVGAPAVHASHVGAITMRTPMAGAIPWPTIMLGETSIVDADGVCLGRLAFEDGEGWIAADLRLCDPVPRDPLPGGFWTTPLPVSVHAVWHATNTHGRASYALRRARRRHAWQHEAGIGDDLPDHVPAAPEPRPVPTAPT